MKKMTAFIFMVEYIFYIKGYFFNVFLTKLYLNLSDMPTAIGAR